MLRADRTAIPPSAATVVVTVDPVGDEHRNLFPLLPDGAYVVAIRRDGVLDVASVFAESAAGIPLLRERARDMARHLGGAYLEPCDYCGINCAPAERLQHEHHARTSEMTYRTRWAA